jgi:hypothetical protein
VTVFLHIKRCSGATEVHELRADGDHVAVPLGLLSSEDVVGFDVEICGLARCDSDSGLAGFDPRDRGGSAGLTT